jgi:hypothetical protein
MKPKVIVTSVLTIIVLLAGFFFFRFYFVFGKGVKAGELNQVVYKGYVFKTYEGRIIQAGFKGGTGATVQSYQFDFSVEDKAIADSLMKCSGKQVQVEYKEYFGSLPWRGQQKYIVDKIVSVQ